MSRMSHPHVLILKFFVDKESHVIFILINTQLLKTHLHVSTGDKPSGKSVLKVKHLREDNHNLKDD